MKAETAKTFDPNDPHGFAELGEHHGHHITSTKMLITVILILVALTGLTILTSEAETYLVKEMGWALPEWVNVAVAMSIALVKGAFVLLIFMALRYENPLYSIVFLFCMFAFALFLGLTGMDIDNRGHVYPWKVHAINAGGTGVNMNYPGGTIHVLGETITLPPTTYTGSLANHVKEVYIEQTGISEDEYHRRWAEANHIHEHHDTLSSPARSIARTGPSGALDEAVPGEHAQDAAHSPETNSGH
ncbi:MAG: cytochrome C oxidase subunit IV family protein [Planctomycetota bacterium]|nr:cytochrome C oxidase subunit IV family protein [Planctomycetota bacterium]